MGTANTSWGQPHVMTHDEGVTISSMEHMIMFRVSKGHTSGAAPLRKAASSGDVWESSMRTWSTEEGMAEHSQSGGLGPDRGPGQATAYRYPGGAWALPPDPLCDIPSGCLFAGPWTATRSSLRMLRRVAAFCWPLRPVLLLVSFPSTPHPHTPENFS